MVKYGSKYIHSVPINLQEAEALVNGFNECYNVLQNNIFEADIVQLNNRVPKLLVEYIATTN